MEEENVGNNVLFVSEVGDYRKIGKILDIGMRVFWASDI